MQQIAETEMKSPCGCSKIDAKKLNMNLFLDFSGANANEFRNGPPRRK
jgi:hypothetical protein